MSVYWGYRMSSVPKTGDKRVSDYQLDIHMQFLFLYNV